MQQTFSPRQMRQRGNTYSLGQWCQDLETSRNDGYPSLALGALQLADVGMSTTVGVDAMASIVTLGAGGSISMWRRVRSLTLRKSSGAVFLASLL